MTSQASRRVFLQAAAFGATGLAVGDDRVDQNLDVAREPPRPAVLERDLDSDAPAFECVLVDVERPGGSPLQRAARESKIADGELGLGPRECLLERGVCIVEQRIVEEVYGADRARMEQKLDLDALRERVEGMEPWETVLHVDLDGKHPDDGFSSIPYDKGALFLRRMEEAVGRPAFDRFLRAWFDEHAFQGVTTADFHAFLRDELIAKHPEAGSVDVDAWLYGTGLPDDAPVSESDAFERVEGSNTVFLYRIDVAAFAMTIPAMLSSRMGAEFDVPSMNLDPIPFTAYGGVDGRVWQGGMMFNLEQLGELAKMFR